MGNCNRRSSPHPSLALDCVASQPAAGEQFPLYRLANYRKGGELIDVYKSGDQKQAVNRVEKFIQEHLRLFMYNEGKGKYVTVNDYARWKHRKNKEVSVTIDDVEYSKDESGLEKNGFNSVKEHNVCWSLEYRGALGESILHVLIICDSKVHHRIAKILVKNFPNLAVDIVEGEEFFGMSALHLAIAYGNDSLAQLLVQCGADVSQRATGRFFLPTDQQNYRQKTSNYEGLAYFGEYPLFWSACFENETMYNYLTDRGADPNSQDSFGNAVLHMLVINDKLGMYGYALRHPKSPARNDISNNAGLTPLTLACTLGRNNIFREMLELSSVEFWRYSNITCSAYPLNALDTILPDGKTNWKSALMIILKGQSDNHLDMLEGGVVHRLLDDKWKTFARNQFLKRLVILFQHLLTLSIAVYLRPRCSSISSDNEGDNVIDPDTVVCDDSLYNGTDAQSIIRYCTEIAACISSINYVLIQQGQEIWSQGLLAYLKNLTQSPAKFIFLISNVLILLCVPCRLLQWRATEDILLALALPGSWFFLMFFAGAVRLTGPFVTMIYNMIAGDMVRFGIIYLIVLLGFSQAFYFLFKGRPDGIESDDDGDEDEFDTYIGTWMTLLHMTLGSYQYKVFGLTYYHVLTCVVFVIFMIMVPILLLNMLIAMMGNTYIQVISKSEKEFVKQWANIVLTLERSISQKKAKEFVEAYAIPLKSSSTGDSDEQVKGLMVIKSKNKTKAKQRKGAVMNWKKIGKKIVTKLREMNCKGEELLAHMMAQENPGALADDDAETTPVVGRSGLDDALSQLAMATGLGLNSFQPLVAGGISAAPPASKKPTEKLDNKAAETQENAAQDGGFNNALQCLAWQHDIDLQKKSSASSAGQSDTSNGGKDNKGFILEESMQHVIKFADTGTANQHLENEPNQQVNNVPNQPLSKINMNPIFISTETTSKLTNDDTLRNAPEITEKKTKTKKNKRKKLTRRNCKVESSCPLEANDEKVDQRPEKHKRKKRKRKLKTSNYDSLKPIENPLPHSAQLMKQWSTSSIQSMTTLLGNDDEDNCL